MNTVRGNGREPPVLNRRHIDGPYVIFTDGRMHWLTMRERVRLFFGRETALSLQHKHRPDLHTGSNP